MLLEFSSNAERIGDINNQLSELDRQSRQILVNRVALLHQLNDIQSSDAVLPDEILCHVFVMAREESDDAVLPIILGSVCSRWRRMVRGTPALWSVIGPVPQRRVQHSDVEMLKSFFQNAAQHPIRLHLCLDHLTPTCRVAEEFFSVIFEDNPLRVQKLTLSLQYLASLPINIREVIKCSNMRNLSTISFIARKKGPLMTFPLPLSFHPVINLQTLMVDSCRFRSVEQLSQTRITVFKLRNIPIDQCLDVLLLCPKTVEFHCHSPCEALRRNELQLRCRKILRNLEVFDVDLDGHIYMDTTSQATLTSHILFLLKHFEFPNLKHLGWGTIRTATRYAFEMFLGALKSLITFKFKSCQRDYDVLCFFKYLSPTVRKIYLPGGLNTPKVVLDSVEFVTNRIEPRSLGMTTLEFASSRGYDTTSFTVDLNTIMDDFRRVGVIV